MAHLAAALSGVLVFVAATLLTQTRFGPFTCALRDTAGLLGLTAGAAVVLGAARAWFLPLGWTLGAAAFSGTGPVGEALTWQTQAPGSRPAAVVAAVLSVVGVAAYVSRGPRPRRSSENL